MSVNENEKEQLELVAGVLIRAFAVGVIILGIWVVFSIVGSDAAFKIQEKMFGVAAERIVEMNYLCMGIYKIILFSLFLLPYIGIRWKIKCKCNS
jgi:hypothetical protein